MDKYHKSFSLKDLAKYCSIKSNDLTKSYTIEDLVEKYLNKIDIISSIFTRHHESYVESTWSKTI